MTITIGARQARGLLIGMLVLAMAVFASACSRPVQDNVADRQAALGSQPDKANFLEARQINDIEIWKDQPGKIVNWYIEFPPQSGNVIPLQCRGVPTSSTESLEPNNGAPYSPTYDYFVVPVDGVDIRTSELAGRDGTFGDPIQYRQCFTVDGQYIDVPALGVPYMVSSGVYTFPPSTIKRDFNAEVRLLQAEEIIKRGGCVNPDTLVEIACPTGGSPGASAPAPTLDPANDPQLVNLTPTP